MALFLVLWRRFCLLMCAYFFFLSFNLFNSRLLCFAIRWPLSSEHHSAPWWSRLSSLVTLDSTSADRGFSSLQFRFEGKWSTETFPVPLNWSTMGLILFFFKCHVLQILSYLKFYDLFRILKHSHIFWTGMHLSKCDSCDVKQWSASEGSAFATTFRSTEQVGPREILRSTLTTVNKNFLIWFQRLQL